MTTPTTLTYTLEEFLARFEQRIDRQFAEVNDKLTKIDKQFAEVNDKLNKLEVGQADISSNVKNIDKRIDNQEFINRSILVALIVALIGGIARWFALLPTG
jgi:septal ring factor EnvC (AmiA/AmiB activator)